MKTLPLVAAALLVGTSAHAQDRTREIDEIFRWTGLDAPGCAVGVSQNGKVVANRAYGLADLERKVPLTPATAFDIGSVQKQFVAAAVLLLVEQGRLSLSDDIRMYLPELPDYGHEITVDHLLTHTSGIRDWTGLLPLAEGDPDALTLILRQRGLNFVPGEQWAYSNSGFVLLREIVARASGMPLSEFLRRRVFEPLGMTSSSYVADVLDGSDNVALAYEKEGDRWRRHMRLGNNRGGGALLSTAGDLLVWNEALASGRLGALVTEKLQETARLNNGRTLSYARGLIVETNRGRRMVWHSGGAAGYSTVLARFPEHGLSVAVLCNTEPASGTALVARTADLFLPPADPAAGRGPVAAAGVDVTGRAGLFFDERTGEPLRLIANNGRLTIANGPTLVPVSADRLLPQRAGLFFRSQDEFQLRFVSPDRFELTSMEGEVTPFRRAASWAPSAADLQALDGRYRSEELGTVLEIVAREDGLAMRVERARERSLELSPVERDVFMRGMMIVRFRRDGSGKVVGFDYANPVARDLRFLRLGDRTAAAATPTPAAPGTAAPRLEALTGEYQLAPGRTLTITLEDGRLYGTPAGNPKRALAHVSGTTFGVVGAPAGTTVTFSLGSDGRATAVVMRRGDRERSLPRIR